MNTKLALVILATAIVTGSLSVYASSVMPSALRGSDQRLTAAAPKPAALRKAKTYAVVRRPGETLDTLARRVLPAGSVPWTNPLEMQFAPLGKVIVIIFQNRGDDASVADDPSVYRGWVLVPDGKTDGYQVEVLPSIAEGFATLDYEIRSIFTADGDGDGAPELCILSEVNRFGSGDRGTPYYDTDLFKWTGTAFTLLGRDQRHSLYGLRNDKAVRARLRKFLAQPSDDRTLHAH